MQPEEDVENKIKELQRHLEDSENLSEHFKTVYESQVYILKWVLQK